MRFKFIVLICSFILFFGCNKTRKEEAVSVQTNSNSKSSVLTVTDINKQRYRDFELDVAAIKIIENWKPYKEMALIVSNVKQANFTDLTDNTEVLHELISNLRYDIPSALKSSSILARIKVLETKLFKLESLVNLDTKTKKNLLIDVISFLESFSNLNFQINKKLERDSQNISRPQ